MPPITLRIKLLAAFLVINIMSVLSIAVISNQATTATLKKDVGANLKSLAASNALAAGNLLARQIDALSSLSTNRVLRMQVTNASNGYSGERDEITNELLARDVHWLTATDTDLLVHNVLENTAATQIVIFQELFPNFVEVILTDRYGGLTATTNRTTDFYQADETWWRAAYNDGQGAIFLGQPVFDESTATLGVEIAVPIHAVEAEDIAGVLKATFRLARFSDLLMAGESQQQNLRVYLLFEDDRMLADGEYLTNLDPATIARLRETNNDTYTELSLSGEPGLVSQSRVKAITGETPIENLDWQIVVFQERESALTPITAQRQLMLVLSVITIVWTTVTALWLAQILTRPIRHLTQIMYQVRKGNTQTRVPVKSADEIGQLTLAFNDMTERLSISIKTLEQEIAERKRTEEELARYRDHLEDLVTQRTAEITAANAELKKLSRVKDEFVSNVSHELKTPITNLNLRYYILRKKPELIAEQLGVLERETARLGHTIEDLLRLSHLDQGQTEVILGPVDLNLMAQNLVCDRTMQAQQKGLALTCAGPADLPVILADEGLIEQVMSILLTNAINYTLPGGQITISTHTEHKDLGPWIGFSVKDTGLGIPVDEQPHLFERFFQGTANRQSGVPGTGLGLAIAKEIVKRHQGHIAVESSGVPGEGTTFSVWLPMTVQN